MRALCMFFPSFVSALPQTNVEAQNEPCSLFSNGALLLILRILHDLSILQSSNIQGLALDPRPWVMQDLWYLPYGLPIVVKGPWILQLQGGVSTYMV